MGGYQERGWGRRETLVQGGGWSGAGTSESGVSAGVTAVARGAGSLLGESIPALGVAVTHPDEVTAQRGVSIG